MLLIWLHCRPRSIKFIKFLLAKMRRESGWPVKSCLSKYDPSRHSRLLCPSSSSSLRSQQWPPLVSLLLLRLLRPYGVSEDEPLELRRRSHRPRSGRRRGGRQMMERWKQREGQGGGVRPGLHFNCSIFLRGSGKTG